MKTFLRVAIITMGLLCVAASSDRPATEKLTNFSCVQSAITATTQCQAAPGAGRSLYLTDAWLANGTTTASTINVVTGTGTNCASGATNVTPPTALASNAGAGAFVTFSFKTAIKVVANQAVCCKTAGSTAFSCVLSGYAGP